MGRPSIDFTAVKSAVSFEQVLEHYGFTAKMHRTRNGDGLDGPCPIHPDATGKDAFKVTLSKNCWYCHNSVCKCGGNHLDFVAKMENCDAHEAALKIDQWFSLGLAGKSDAPHGTSRHSSPTAQLAVASARFTPRQQPHVEEEGENKPLNFKLENLKTDHPYLAERGLTPATVAEFGLGFCAKGTMSGRIVIPIHKRGRRTGWICRPLARTTA